MHDILQCIKKADKFDKFSERYGLVKSMAPNHRSYGSDIKGARLYLWVNISDSLHVYTMTQMHSNKSTHHSSLV